MADRNGDQGSRAYAHEPLDLSRSCIRAVRILPGAADSPVRCTIRTITLSHPYRALSYTWGSPSTNRILLNDHPFEVRDNLSAFLVQARTLGIEDDIFIDAICIDQTNTAERNHQVRLMAEIYRSAELVYVWPFGRQFFCDSKPWTRLPLLSGKVSPSNALLKKDLSRKLACLAKAQHQQRVHKLATSLTPTHWHHLIVLCQAPYWTRLWVCQEVVLARQICILYGPSIVDWNGLSKLAEYVNSTADLHDGIPSWVKAAPWSRISKFRKTSAMPSLTLLDLIRTIGPMKCDNVRDRVYGLLGLASDGQKIAINYEECTSRLCVRLFQLYSEGNAKVLEDLAKYLDLPDFGPKAFLSGCLGRSQDSTDVADVELCQFSLFASFGRWDVYSMFVRAHRITTNNTICQPTPWNCGRCSQAMNRPHDVNFLLHWLHDAAAEGTDQIRLCYGEIYAKAIPPDLIIVGNKSKPRELCLECKELKGIEEAHRQAVQDEILLRQAELHLQQSPFDTLSSLKGLDKVEDLVNQTTVRQTEVCSRILYTGRFCSIPSLARTQLRVLSSRKSWKMHDREDPSQDSVGIRIMRANKRLYVTRYNLIQMEECLRSVVEESLNQSLQ